MPWDVKELLVANPVDILCMYDSMIYTDVEPNGERLVLGRNKFMSSTGIDEISQQMKSMSPRQPHWPAHGSTSYSAKKLL